MTVGRYLLHRKIARGGMASIHIARLMGDVGFSRIVAAKRMHPELAGDAEFVAMFLDEARIASKVHHRNVVPVFDVVTMGSEVMLVQEYVHGAPLSLLLHNSNAAQAHVPIPVAASIACQVLSGLHAAHETCDEIGTPLNIVHRDVSPQNIMIALDGSARLLDFGVAKAAMSAHVTRKGTFKGKLGYSSPEQIRGEATRQSDIYALGVVMWELIVGHRMHGNTKGEAALIAEILAGKLPTITDALAEERSWIGAYRWSQLEALEPIIRKALDSNVRRRWATAADMEEAIAAAVPIATAADVSQWLRAVGKDFLDERERMIAAEEQSWRRFAANGSGSQPAMGTQRLELTSTATEPDQVPPSKISIRARFPTALIAALIVLLGMGIAFLIQDLKKSEQPAHVDKPVATEAAPPATKARPAAAPAATPTTESTTATPTATPATSATTTHEATSPSAAAEGPTEEQTAAQPDEQPAEQPDAARAEPHEPRDVTTDPPRKKSTARQTKVRTVRPAPARTTPPARTPTAAAPKASAAGVDCSTPFYFEGKKKIFKPGCL
ncbi:MAG: protein kinase [Kofleriaceae bacterium]|nr:protein kinase [Kofleriaceae bacterium]